MKRVHFAAVAFGLTIGALTLPASAQVTQSDLLVAGRALGFVNTLKQRDVRIGIVYDPGIARSAQQAAELDAMMAGGLRIGGLFLTPVMVSIDILGSAGVEALFLTDGLGTEAARVGRASRMRKLPCITFDIGQVQNGACAMGVRSQPKIEVFVNRAAAEATGMELAAVFRIMITEIKSNEAR